MARVGDVTQGGNLVHARASSGYVGDFFVGACGGQAVLHPCHALGRCPRLDRSDTAGASFLCRVGGQGRQGARVWRRIVRRLAAAEQHQRREHHSAATHAAEDSCRWSCLVGAATAAPPSPAHCRSRPPPGGLPAPRAQPRGERLRSAHQRRCLLDGPGPGERARLLEECGSGSPPSEPCCPLPHFSGSANVAASHRGATCFFRVVRRRGLVAEARAPLGAESLEPRLPHEGRPGRAD